MGRYPYARECKKLKAKNTKLKKALKEIIDHENWLGITSVYYDQTVFTTAEKALKEQ